MIPLLRCPKVSTELISKYLSYSNDERKYSNFGFCENLLRKRFAKILGIDRDRLILGSSATLLLNISCNLFSDQINKNKGIIYFPAFSFFSTFSISSSLNNEIYFYDIEEDSFLPLFTRKITHNDLIYLNVPFGLSKQLEFFLDFAARQPCKVIIDAAACLPGVIYRNKKFDNIPDNVIIVFSLHATKLISSGEGGLCLIGKSIPNYLIKLTNFGLNSKRIQAWKNSTNAKMSEFNAAAGLASLDMAEKNIDDIIAAKRKVSAISRNHGLNLLDNNCEPSLTLNVISNSDKKLIDTLSENNYEYRRWWSLTDKLSVENHSNSINYFKSIIGLPFDWENIDDYFDKMCNAIGSY